jgi:CheY-like chemotaxis protein
MARVLICEPHDDVRALLELVVRRLGHEPAAYLGRPVEHIGVDVAVIEPGESDGLSLALSLRAQNVPVIFTSIYPPTDDLLQLAPSAYLVKPFPLYTLERALVQALALVSTPAAAAG